MPVSCCDIDNATVRPAGCDGGIGWTDLAPCSMILQQIKAKERGKQSFYLSAAADKSFSLFSIVSSL